MQARVFRAGSPYPPNLYSLSIYEPCRKIKKPSDKHRFLVCILKYNFSIYYLLFPDFQQTKSRIVFFPIHHFLAIAHAERTNETRPTLARRV